MLALIGAFFLSMVPAAVLSLWLIRLKDMPEDYAKTATRSLIAGVISVLPVVACSAVLNVAGGLAFGLTGIRAAHPFWYDAYYKFIVLALSEEIMKFLAMKKAVGARRSSHLEWTVFMVLTGTGFEVIEAIPYAIGSGVPHMLVRGFTIMHAAFGLITGYFYGKSRREGKRGYAVFGILLAWFLHGLYDFTLTAEIMEVSDLVMFIPLSIAALSVVLLVVIVVFVLRARKREKYLEPC